MVGSRGASMRPKRRSINIVFLLAINVVQFSLVKFSQVNLIPI